MKLALAFGAFSVGFVWLAAAVALMADMIPHDSTAYLFFRVGAVFGWLSGAAMLASLVGRVRQ